VSLDDLQYDRYYDTVVPCEGSTAGIITLDGIACAHFFSNVMDGNVGGSMHGAHALNSKLHQSTISGHSHALDYKIASTPSGRKIQGLVVGIFTDQLMDYSGVAQRSWRRGCVVLRGVEDGPFDPEFVSLTRLKELYED
jgi:hypothetical protein